MLLSDAISYFLDARAGLASKTLRINKQYLHSLRSSLGDRDINTVTIVDLRMWRKHLIERPVKYGGDGRRPVVSEQLSPHTVHGHIRVARQFFRWLAKEELIPENIAARLEQVNISNQVPTSRMMSDDDFAKMLDASHGDAPAQIRDRAILWFLRQTGARLGGAANLLLTDLDLERRRAEVIEKGKGGGTIRLVFYKDEAVNALIEWLEMRAALPQHCANVFVTVPNQAGLGGGTPLSEESIYARYWVLRKRANAKGDLIVGRTNPHSQRHAIAKRALENGANLAAVSKILGHKSIRPTGDFYGRYEDQEAQAAHEQFT